MNRKITGITRGGAILGIAIVLVVPAVAHAGSGAEPPASAARDTAAQRAEDATGGGGLDRRDAAVGAALAVGILLMGLRGYVVAGAAIAVAAAVLGSMARLVTGKPKASHAWSDWPGPARPPRAVGGSRARERADANTGVTQPKQVEPGLGTR